MAIPLLAYGAGSFLLNKLFSQRPKYDLPPAPEFFGKDYEDALAAQKHMTQARYGGGVNDLRELLANQGVLGNQGALTDAFTRQNIAQGQDISAGENAITQQEYGAKKNFEGLQYGAGVDRNKLMYTNDVNQRNSQIDMLSKLGALGGYLLGNKGDAVQTPIAGTPGNQPYAPNDPLFGTGLGLEGDQNHMDFGRKLIKTLFGI